MASNLRYIFSGFIIGIAMFAVFLFFLQRSSAEVTTEALSGFLAVTEHRECVRVYLQKQLHQDGKIHRSTLDKSEDICAKQVLLSDTSSHQARIDWEEVATEELADDSPTAEEATRKKVAAAKAEADRVARLKHEQEEARAKALADMLAKETQYQRIQAGRGGNQVAVSYDDVIRRYVSEQWRRPPTARNGMLVEVRISMLPSGDITDTVVVRSSGDAGFDQSAVQAVRNVGRIPEMQQLSRENPAAFDRMYRQRNLRFKPEDLDF